ncbi:hypothetical protein [Caballeronia sp. 15711]|uniref:hypothetical protein n=1 Tax=Caballeronia sp. 15711 TaxID=3391029 RepID=UPI0039E48FCD
MIGVVDPTDTLTASGFVIQDQRNPAQDRVFLEDIIYREYRCALLHEGQLSGKAKFVSRILPNVTQYGIDNGCWFSIGWEADGTFLFDSGLLDVLDRAVSGARINGEAFGVVHPPQFIYEHLGVANDDEVRRRVEGAFGLPNGGWMSIRSAVEILARHGADWDNEESIAALLRDLVASQIIIDGTMTGLRFAGIVGDDRTLSARGFEMLKLAASCYRLAQVA